MTKPLNSALFLLMKKPGLVPGFLLELFRRCDVHIQ